MRNNPPLHVYNLYEKFRVNSRTFRVNSQKLRVYLKIFPLRKWAQGAFVKKDLVKSQINIFSTELFCNYMYLANLVVYCGFEPKFNFNEVIWHSQSEFFIL